MRISLGWLRRYAPDLDRESQAVFATGSLSGVLSLLFTIGPSVALGIAAANGIGQGAMLTGWNVAQFVVFGATAVATVFGLRAPKRTLPIATALAGAVVLMVVTTFSINVWTFVLTYTAVGLMVPFHHALSDSIGRQFTGSEGRYELRRATLANWIAGGGLIVGAGLIALHWSLVHLVLMAPLLMGTAIAVVGWREPADATPARPPRVAAAEAGASLRRLWRLLRGTEQPRDSRTELISYAQALLVNCFAQFAISVAGSAVALYYTTTYSEPFVMLITGAVMLLSAVLFPQAGRAADGDQLAGTLLAAAIGLSLAGGAVLLSERIAGPPFVAAIVLGVGYLGTATTTGQLTGLVRTKLNKKSIDAPGVMAVAAAGWLAGALGTLTLNQARELPGSAGLLIAAAGAIVGLTVTWHRWRESLRRAP